MSHTSFVADEVATRIKAIMYDVLQVFSDDWYKLTQKWSEKCSSVDCTLITRHVRVFRAHRELKTILQAEVDQCLPAFKPGGSRVRKGCPSLARSAGGVSGWRGRRSPQNTILQVEVDLRVGFCMHISRTSSAHRTCMNSLRNGARNVPARIVHQLKMMILQAEVVFPGLPPTQDHCRMSAFDG